VVTGTQAHTERIGNEDTQRWRSSSEDTQREGAAATRATNTRSGELQRIMFVKPVRTTCQCQGPLGGPSTPCSGSVGSIPRILATPDKSIN
jgi:hypothetical protein